MSEQDFTSMLEREWAPVLAVSMALVSDRSAAEELTQDAFLAAHRRWDRVAAMDRPGAWVRRVVINRSISHLRRRRIEHRVLGLVGRDPLRHEPADVPGEAGEHDAALWNQVRALPARQAHCIVLRHVDGLSAAEIGEVLGCAEATVRVHLHRGLTTLRSRLDTDTDTGTAAARPPIGTI